MRIPAFPHFGRPFAYLMVTLAFVVSVGLATMLNSRTNELAKRADTLARQNSALLKDFEKFRQVRVRQTTAADVKLCRAINTITRRDRATLRQSQKNTARFLRLLGIGPTQLAAIAKASYESGQREIARRPLVKCGQLPTTKPAP